MLVLLPLAEVICRLERQGIDMDELAAQLQKEAAESFVKSWDEEMDAVARKAQAVHPQAAMPKS